MKRKLIVSLVLLSLLIVGCAEQDPGDLLADQIYERNENWMWDRLLGDVTAESNPAHEGLFDVTARWLLSATVDQDGNLMMNTPDELRLRHYALVIHFMDDYRDAALDDQIYELSFNLMHPESEEVLIEIRLQPDARDAIITRYEEIGSMEETVPEVPGLASAYQDRLDALHYEEILSFSEDLFGFER